MDTEERVKKFGFSYSSTDTYNTCALQFREVNWYKNVPGSTNAAAERGTVMHDEFEHCILDDTDYSMPEYQWVLDEFRDQTGLKMAEMKLAIDINWKPCPYDWDEETQGERPVQLFYRGKIDFTCLNGTHAMVSDLKTGKRKFKTPKPFERWLINKHEDGMAKAPQMQANARQANDYALLVFIHFPQIETMTFRFVWSDVDEVTEDVFNFSRIDDRKNMVKTMRHTPLAIQLSAQEDNWTPNPGGLCYQWCDVPKSTCRFHGMRYGDIKKLLDKEAEERRDGQD